MMMPHPAQVDPSELQQMCEIRRQRRSGPGGQHRNKVETGIFIEHRPTGIRAEATERRSQQQNLESALFRLRLNLAIEYRHAALQEVSELWNSRLQSGKIRVSPQHTDFPALLAEALDALEARSWETRATAEHLGCSASQLVKFLKLEPRAFAELNHQRVELGLARLK